MARTREELVEAFICPGCVCGSDTKCGKYDPEAGTHGSCRSHVLGTMIMPLPGNIALGLPKGFNRPGHCRSGKRTHSQMIVRVWVEGTRPDWNSFNVPVWALVQDGVLFVRTGMPRIGEWAVDVIDGGTPTLCPQAIDWTGKTDLYD